MLEKVAAMRLKIVRDNLRALTYGEMMELADEIRSNLIDAGAVDETALMTYELANALSDAALDREYFTPHSGATIVMENAILTERD